VIMDNGLFPALLVVLGLALASSPAYALTAYDDICVNYTVDFNDADTGVGDDVLTSDDPVPARGVRITVKEGWGLHHVVAQDFAETSGIHVGCLHSVALTVGSSYLISAESRAKINGNLVVVHDDDTDDQPFVEGWIWIVPSLLGATRTVTTSNEDPWSIMAAASEIAYRQNGGLSGKKWQWYNQVCPESGSGQAPSCLHVANGGWNAYACDRTTDGDTGTANDCDLNDQAPALHKYEVGHQMGHLASFFVSGSSSGDTGPYYNDGAGAHTCNAAPQDTGAYACPGGTGHNINSMEYQSQAAYEGMADIWAATAFNYMGGSPGCKFVSYTPVDWDNDGKDDNQVFDCGGGNICEHTDTGPCQRHGVSGTDYQGNECTATAGEAVEVDYLRFWWQTVRDYGLRPDDILSIWNSSDPHHWYSGDACISDTGTSDTGVVPDELEQAAVDSGFVTGAQWDTATSTNGTGR